MQELPPEEARAIADQAFKHKTSVWVENFDTDEEPAAQSGATDRVIGSALAVPLLDEAENCFGVILYESNRNDAFKESDQVFLETVAGQAMLAVKNAQAYAREKRLAEDRQALIDILGDIVRQLDSPQAFDTILERTFALTGSEAGVLLLYDSERGDLWQAAQRGVMPSKQESRLALDQGIVGWLIRQWRETGQTSVNVADIEIEPWQHRYESYIEGVHAQLSVLLVDNNELRGVISVESRTPNNFRARDEILLKAFADLAVIALQSAERYRTMAERGNQLQILHTIDREIIRQQEDPDQVMRSIVESSWRLVQADYVELLLYRSGSFRTIYAARTDEVGNLQSVTRYSAGESKLEHGILARVAATKQSYRTRTPASQDPYYAPGQAFSDQKRAESEVAVPLLDDKDALIGVLNLESEQPFVFNDAHTRILETLASQAVIAIQNARNFEQTVIEQRRFANLYSVGQRLSEVTDIERIHAAYKIVMDVAAQHTSGRIVLRRYDAQRQELRVEPEQVRIGQGIHPTSIIPLGKGWNGWVAEHHQTLWIEDVNHLPPGIEPSPYAPPEMNTYLIVPIMLHEGDYFYGTLSLSNEQEKFFTDADVALFEGLAQQLALTIYRLQTVWERQQAEKIDYAHKWSKWIVHDLPDYLGRVQTNIDDVNDVLEERDVFSAEIDSALSAIGEAVQAVLEERHDLVDVLDDPNLTIEMAAVPVKAIIESARMAAKLPETIVVDLVIDDDALMVQVNAKQVEDIVKCLLVNAKEAMSQSGVITINVDAMQTVTPQKYVAIVVSDSGNGIRPQVRPFIFMQGFSTKGGSGLGLPMAQQYARQNGGELSLLDSSPSGGAAFRLILPEVSGADNGVSG